MLTVLLSGCAKEGIPDSAICKGLRPHLIKLNDVTVQHSNETPKSVIQEIGRVLDGAEAGCNYEL